MRFALLLACSVAASTAWAADDWVVFAKAEDGMVAKYSPSRTRSGLTWVRYEYAADQRLSNGTAYRAAVVKLRTDCHEQALSVDYAIYYNNANSLVFNENHKGGFIPAAPESLYEVLLQRIC